MDGGLVGEATLAPHRVARLLEGGGGHRHRPVPGGAQPEARPHALPVLASQLPVLQQTASEGSHRDSPVRVGHDRAPQVYGEQEDRGSLRSAKEGEEGRDLARRD